MVFFRFASYQLFSRRLFFVGFYSQIQKEGRTCDTRITIRCLPNLQVSSRQA